MHLFSLLCSVVLAMASVGASAARPVLIEEFTATWCGYCYGAGTALDQLETTCSSSQAIVLVYHDRDDYELEAGIVKYYYYNLNYIPTTIFNGVIKNEGFGSLSYQGLTAVVPVYNKFVADLAQETSRTASINPFTLTLTGDVFPADPFMILTVKTTTGYPRPVKAKFFIAEDHIPVTAPNGQRILNGVARAFLGEQQVYLPSKGKVTLTASIPGSFTCLNAARLRPVVFLQDDSNQEVMAVIGSFQRTASQTSWVYYQ